MIRNGEDDAGKLMGQADVSTSSLAGSGGAWGSVGGRKSKGYTLRYGLWRCSLGSWYLSWLWVLWFAPWWTEENGRRFARLKSHFCNPFHREGPEAAKWFRSKVAISQRLLLGYEISQTLVFPLFYNLSCSKWLSFNFFAIPPTWDNSKRLSYI